MNSSTRKLTVREREVVTLLAYGYTNIEVARWLSISVRTAEEHREHATAKISAESRADVVGWALKNHVLQ